MKWHVIRWTKLFLLAAATCYILLCAAIAMSQRQLIYHPRILTTEEVTAAAQEDHLQRWQNAAGENIGMKRPAPQQPARGQVLITYGNGSSAVGCAHYADDIQRLSDFDVYILEYPGYQDRPGTPTEKSIFRAADEAFSRLPTNSPTYLVGESLGTGVAAYLAGTYPERVKGVVLMAPYNHLSGPAQYHYPYLPVSLLLVDRFTSDFYLTHYHGPVGIMVGTADSIVPEKFGRRLYDGYAGPKRLWEFPDAEHGDVFDQLPAIWNQLIQFWQAK